jgi:signal peptidase I
MEQTQKRMLLDSLARFGSCDVTVSGESMKPFILPGDRVHIALTPRPFMPGHALAFFTGNQLIIHRICAVRKDPDGNRIYSIRGDSSPDSHGEISAQFVAGRVQHVHRHGRKYYLWFHYPFCLVTLLVGPAMRVCVSLRKALRTSGKG